MGNKRDSYYSCHVLAFNGTRKLILLDIYYLYIGVAVHEYANSTSAHDTVLEHRFSPTQTPFTSWQYANERGQGWSCAVSSSRFHTINTARVHTQSCIPSHHLRRDNIQHNSTPRQDKIVLQATLRYSYRIKIINIQQDKKSTFLSPLHGSSERRPTHARQQRN